MARMICENGHSVSVGKKLTSAGCPVCGAPLVSQNAGIDTQGAVARAHRISDSLADSLLRSPLEDVGMVAEAPAPDTDKAEQNGGRTDRVVFED